MPLQTKQSSPSLADNALRLPTQFPELPKEVQDRFPTIEEWQQEVKQFFQKYESAMRDFAGAVQDTNELGGVLIADPDTGAIYIRPTRGGGTYADPDTPFFVNRDGFFSLGGSLTWNPSEDTLTIKGEIIVTSGEIGGFDIGPDYIRDSADSFGLSSEVTAGDDVRFWAGDTFANRATAPFRVYESGAVVATNATITGSITVTSGTIGGFDIGADYIRDGVDSFGLSSEVTAGDDVRFWAGDTFANRGTAPFRVYESGAIAANSGIIGGFTIGATQISATDILLDSAAPSITIGSGVTQTLIDPSGIIFGDADDNVIFEVISGRVKLLLQGYGAGASAYLSIDDSIGSSHLYLGSLTGLGGSFLEWLNGILYLGDSSGVLFNLSSATTGRLDLSGGLTIGDPDTNLYRSAADHLKTDDLFEAANLTVTAGGVLKVGNANTPIADTPVIGFINITDSAGAVKRVAVV